jgi:hypothetical protein
MTVNMRDDSVICRSPTEGVITGMATAVIARVINTTINSSMSVKPGRRLFRNPGFI